MNILILCVVAFSMAAPLAQAAPGQLVGRIYWDQNNNGRADSGESGISGILVTYKYGAAQLSAVTDANGQYTITGASGSARLTVHSGWLRSACNSLHCGTGTSGGNDFAVENQIITRSGVNGGNGGTYNAGLVPAWGGTYPIPSPLVSAPVDIAGRLSFPGSCSGGRTCAVGDTILAYATFFNQGTSAITNPEFVLEMPVGHVVQDGSWEDPRNVLNAANPAANTITVLEPFSAAQGYGRYRLNGTLPAGANSSMAFSAQVTSAALASPTPYASSDPYDKQGTFRITSIGQSGDRDSTFCEADGATWHTGSCAIEKSGVHDKTVPLDHIDGAGWSVSTGTYVARGYDASLQATLAANQSANVATGETVSYQMRVANNGSGEARVRNVRLEAALPVGMNFSAAANPGWTLSGNTLATTVTAQLLPGQVFSVPLHLNVNSAAAPTVELQTAITAFVQADSSANGTFMAATDGNTANNTSAIVVTVNNDSEPPAPDVTPPTTPDQLTATATSPTSVNLTWGASTDDSGDVSYQLRRDGQLIATQAGTTYADNTLNPETIYDYTINAIDPSGNTSTSVAASAATPPPVVEPEPTVLEFVTNKSVETSLYGWSGLWGAKTVISREAGDAHDGDYAIRTTTTSSNNTSAGFTGYAASERWVTNTVNGTPYTASAWVKTSHANMKVCIRLSEYSGSAKVGHSEACATTSTTGWLQIGHTRTAGGDGRSMTVSVYCSSMNNSRFFLADDFSVTAPN